VPAGFAPASFTAISDDTWWLLGTAPCASPPCTSLVRTDDGGRSFVGVPAPRTAAVSEVRFADSRDGFAYGPALWVTHNAGASWHQLYPGGSITAFAIAGGNAYAIVSSASTGRLVRTPIGSDGWQDLPAAGNAYAGLWAHGSDVLLESSTSASAGYQLAVSHDAGATFSRYPVPPSVACDFEEMAPPVVWAHCATGMMSGAWRSVDDGRSFQPAGGVGSRTGPELPNSAAFAAASSTTAVVGYQQLYRTADGGASYSLVVGPSGVVWWRYLGFTDATDGVALGYLGSVSPSNERLYRTTDGGLSYHLVPIG
jgi:hypothetical protein